MLRVTRFVLRVQKTFFLLNPQRIFYLTVFHYLVIQKSQVECPDGIINYTGFPLEFIPYLIRGGNDMFFQLVPSLSVIPAEAGIQEQ